MTKQEKFDYLKAKHPNLALLQERLGLEVYIAPTMGSIKEHLLEMLKKHSKKGNIDWRKMSDYVNWKFEKRIKPSTLFHLLNEEYLWVIY